MSPRLDKSAPIFAALGDQTRLRIVARLSSSGPMSIAKLTEGTEVTRQAVTKHLEVLRHAGLAQSSTSGRERLWQLEPKPLASAREALDTIAAQWEQALGRLKAFVERPS